MKKTILFLSLLFVISDLSAGVPYFCEKAGTTLYYERYEEGSGKVVRRTVLDYVSVAQNGTCKNVEYGMLISKANGHPLLGGRAQLVTVITENGDAVMDLGAYAKEVLSNIFPIATVTAERADSVLPSDMKPGDVLPDVHVIAMVGAFKCSFETVSRQVLRTERVHTPAGDFDAVVVREYKVEIAPMYTKYNWVDSWYVRGLGYVRHDSYDRKMRKLTSEVLVRID